MRAQMWMATGQLGAWVPCPNSPLESVSEGVSTDTRLLSGGSFVHRSLSSRRQYTPVWDGSADELQPIQDLYNGIYGDGPFYFIDPAATSNVLPPHWAAPMLSTNGMTLVKGVTGVRSPTTVPATYNPPPFQVTYTLPTATPVFGDTTPRATVAIPPDRILNLRIWGSATGSALVRINAYNRATGVGLAADYVPSSVGVQGIYTGAVVSHIEIWVTKLSTVLSTITLGAMRASINLVNTPPIVWSSGKGISGVQFLGSLGHTTYQAVGVGRESMNATLVEVGSWLR